jgi:hypothetical protein
MTTIIIAIGLSLAPVKSAPTAAKAPIVKPIKVKASDAEVKAVINAIKAVDLGL